MLPGSLITAFALCLMAGLAPMSMAQGTLDTPGLRLVESSPAAFTLEVTAGPSSMPAGFTVEWMPRTD